MKRIVMISFAFLMMLGSFVCNGQNSKSQKPKGVVAQKIEVYYFHFSRRCPTCMAVESESKSNLMALYPKQVKEGAITFKSINLDESNNEAIAKKCKANGQSLLVISGKKRIDLTSDGFMYARNNPDKFKGKIKSTIDPILGGK